MYEQRKVSKLTRTAMYKPGLAGLHRKQGGDVGL